jgi:hypothetical protein
MAFGGLAKFLMINFKLKIYHFNLFERRATAKQTEPRLFGNSDLRRWEETGPFL